jgi:dihydroorotase
LKGKELSDFQRLSEEGAIAFSDDGMPVADADLMEKALVEAKKCNALIISHCEDLEIVNGGIMNKGKISEQLDVPGIDRRSEDSITLRDVELAKKTGARLHIAHVSTRGAVEIIRKAKADGVNVTCETAPHYFWFTENDLLTQDADFRMNPPLRTEDDKKAIIEGLVDGTIDCISTDHAPHTPDEKSNFLKAPNGVIGLETALPATLTALYHTNILTLDRIVELMSTNPRKILRLPPIKATVTVDLDLEWTVKPADFLSKGKNCPFKGLKLKGKVVS